MCLSTLNVLFSLFVSYALCHSHVSLGAFYLSFPQKMLAQTLYIDTENSPLGITLITTLDARSLYMWVTGGARKRFGKWRQCHTSIYTWPRSFYCGWLLYYNTASVCASLMRLRLWLTTLLITNVGCWIVTLGPCELHVLWSLLNQVTTQRVQAIEDHHCLYSNSSGRGFINYVPLLLQMRPWSCYRCV